jgi:hypothetical protein
MKTETVFTCQRDGFSTLTSIAVPAGAAMMLLLAVNSTQDSQPALLSGAALLLLLTIIFWLYAPLAYAVNSEGITIRRRAGHTKIAANQIAGIRVASPEEMQGIIRVFGNGGLFGYTGRYYSRKLGHQRWFCSRRSGLVFIERHNAILTVISPDEPEAFVAAVKNLRTA